MTDKYRDNKRDGVASDYTYGDDISLKSETKTTSSMKGIITLLLVFISIVSIFLNILQFNQIKGLKNKKVLSSSKMEKLNQQLITNSKKIDVLTKKIELHIKLLKK